MANEIKKPSPVDQTGNGDAAQMAFGDVFKPQKHSNTSKAPAQVVIADLLRTGAENGLRLCELTRLTGLNERVVHQLIHNERLAGVPILADQKSGYYLPQDGAERERWLRSMYHRAREIIICANAVERGGREGGILR